MKISELKSEFLNELEELYPSEEIQSFFNLLAEKFLTLSRIEIALNPQIEIEMEVLLSFQKALFRLKEQEPIQYIIGETEFFGLLFKVNKHTLIPRPETEELVNWIITEQTSEGMTKPLQILDIGTGSGCIAVSLAKNLSNARVCALDISDNALGVARENAQLNEVEVNFYRANILDSGDLSPFSLNQFDVIVSNPPYVRELEKKQMRSNVLDYEPHTALFVKDQDPLLFYKAICQFAKARLKQGGFLYFEINEAYKSEMEILLENEGFQNVEVRKDIYGKDRMLRGNL